jgi:hypothetical protein
MRDQLQLDRCAWRRQQVGPRPIAAIWAWPAVNQQNMNYRTTWDALEAGVSRKNAIPGFAPTPGFASGMVVSERVIFRRLSPRSAKRHYERIRSRAPYGINPPSSLCYVSYVSSDVIVLSGANGRWQLRAGGLPVSWWSGGVPTPSKATMISLTLCRR